MWLRNHDEEAKEIANQAYEYVNKVIVPETLMEYIYEILYLYSTIQKFYTSAIYKTNGKFRRKYANLTNIYIVNVLIKYIFSMLSYIYNYLIKLF